MPTIIHFDIGADDVARAKAFYGTLFDWKMFSPPGFDAYTLIETAGPDGQPGIGGGLAQRGDEAKQIVMYVGVDDIDKYLEDVPRCGGTVLQGKLDVPGFGLLALCADTEGNPFGLWQSYPEGD